MANKAFSDWLASLAQATAQAGDLIPIVQGGVSKKAPAGQAGGFATLDANGMVAQPANLRVVRSSLTSSVQFTGVTEYEIARVTLPENGLYLVLATVSAARDGGTWYPGRMSLWVGAGVTRVWANDYWWLSGYNANASWTDIHANTLVGLVRGQGDVAVKLIGLDTTVNYGVKIGSGLIAARVG